MNRRLILGTHNPKKGRELQALLRPLGILTQTLAEVSGALDVVEDGDSFAANAQLKASQQAKHLGQWVLGEDSGLAVDALGGDPGIYSARYAGSSATDEQNNQKLLAALAAVPDSGRTAHYVCHTALSDPTGHIVLDSEARCRGRITRTPAGTAGFGYDPLFEVPEYHRTFGQLGDAVKSVLSHRARALDQLLPRLAELVRSGRWEDAAVARRP